MKCLSFTLENLNGKLIFWSLFLPFSRAPGAVGEFFAFYFFPFAVWGDFSGWCGIQADWGESSPPRPPCQGMAGRYHISTTLFQISRGRKVQTWGEEHPQAASIHTNQKIPANRTWEKFKREKFASSSRTLENERKMVKKVIFQWDFLM